MKTMNWTKKVAYIMGISLVAVLLSLGIYMSNNFNSAEANPSPEWPIRATDNDITIQINRPDKIPYGEALHIEASPQRLARNTVVLDNEFVAASFHAWATPNEAKIVDFKYLTFNAAALQSKWNLPDGAPAKFFFEYYDGTEPAFLEAEGVFYNGVITFDITKYPELCDHMFSYVTIVMDKQYEPKPGPVPPGPDVGPTSPETGIIFS